MADFIMCTTASPTVMCQNAFPGCVSGAAFFLLFQKRFLTAWLCVKIYLLTTCVCLAPSGRLFQWVIEEQRPWRSVLHPLKDLLRVA